MHDRYNISEPLKFLTKQSQITKNFLWQEKSFNLKIFLFQLCLHLSKAAENRCLIPAGITTAVSRTSPQ